MRPTSTEERIQQLYRENRARLDLRAFKAELAERLPSAVNRRRATIARRLSIGVAAVATFAAVAFGSWMAVDQLLPGKHVLVITADTPSGSTAVPATTVASSGDIATTTTAFPEPIPESAWPFPDYTPEPERVPSEQVQELARLVAAHFPSVGFQIEYAVETRPQVVLDFSLAARESDGAHLSATIFWSDAPLPEKPTEQESMVDVPGTVRAYLTERRLPAVNGSLLGYQLLATMADGTVVNAQSTSGSAAEDAPPPLDGDGLIEMATYLVSVLASAEVPLPDLSLSTNTTVAWVCLPQDMAQRCWSTVLNAFSYVAYEKKADFVRLLVPEAQANAGETYRAERERLKASGMSPNTYDNSFALVVVQRKDGAYLTDLGYFVQTRPPVPTEVDAWLRQDPTGRAAAGVTMADETVRWFLLELQPDGNWLISP